MQKVLLVILLLLGGFSSSAQMMWPKHKRVPAPPVCYASDEVHKSFVPPPQELQNMLKSAEKKSEIVVHYSLFPPEAKEAFDYAVGIWEQLIESPVPIHLQANWRPPGQDQANSLGWCSPSNFYKNFPGAPKKEVYYPVALAEKLSGTEMTGSSQPDMTAEFNSEINWYFGTDGNTPMFMYDFVSVVLHEVAHGLGFYGFFFVDGDEGGYGRWEYGDLTSYDCMVEGHYHNGLTDTAYFSNPSLKLKNALISGLLYANSPVVLATENNVRPRLWAPSPWDNGSSIYHLNTNIYPAGNENSLMTHAFGRGQAVHDPGPFTLGIFADMGWKNTRIESKPVKDREEIGPLHFEADISSDYSLDTTRLFVVISTDSFTESSDSIPLILNESGGYDASWTPDAGNTMIGYYITVADDKGRTFTLPNDAPAGFFQVNFGPDNTFPGIEHTPIPYYFTNGKSLKIEAEVSDNLGVDTVFVDYSVNGVPQSPFALSVEADDNYSALFPFDDSLLKDGDVIEYNLTAVDASSNQNTRRIPLRGTFSFKVEHMFDPIGAYQNNFDNPTSDFILSDFDVFTAQGFENGALHSSHPYASPEVDDGELNFITILKYPVILNENSDMSFDEIVLVEPGTTGTDFGDFEFWDYVVVEGSKDLGETWLPVTDGYDASANSSWKTIYNGSITGNNSTATGNPELFVTRQIDILENGNFSAGDTVLFRFRLYSDPYANGWGWAIDNLRIQSPVSVSPLVLSPGNFEVFPNPFTRTFKIETHLNSRVDELQFDIYNMYGQKVQSTLLRRVTGKVSENIELQKATSGMYLLVVKENGRQVFTKKLIHN